MIWFGSSRKQIEGAFLCFFVFLLRIKNKYLFIHAPVGKNRGFLDRKLLHAKERTRSGKKQTGISIFMQLKCQLTFFIAGF